jgi:3D (Asp-Asp-Asp) domain-containing protein
MKLKAEIQKIGNPQLQVKIFVFTLGIVVISAFAAVGIAKGHSYPFVWDSAFADVNVDKPQLEAKPHEVVYEYYAVATAYNSGDPRQCDDTPCIASNGENICTALALGYKRCASNDYPFGTRLYVDGYGECLVVDRMKDDGKIDVAFPAHQFKKAVEFGARPRLIRVLK